MEIPKKINIKRTANKYWKIKHIKYKMPDGKCIRYRIGMFDPRKRIKKGKWI